MESEQRAFLRFRVKKCRGVAPVWDDPFGLSVLAFTLMVQRIDSDLLSQIVRGGLLCPVPRYSNTQSSFRGE